MSTVLITGANRGLGLEFVKQYAERGETVIACCRHPNDATALNKLQKNYPEKIQLEKLDVCEATSRSELAKKLNGTAVDILINNAGIYGGETHEQNFGTLDEKRWLQVFHTNTLAPILLTEALMPSLTLGKLRKLFFITSQMGSIGDNRSGRALFYRTSKAALNMAVKNLSLSLAPESFVCITQHPGWVKTDMGGPNATMDASESIRRMIKVFDEVSLSDSGKFLSHDGNEIEW